MEAGDSEAQDSEAGALAQDGEAGEDEDEGEGEEEKSEHSDFLASLGLTPGCVATAVRVLRALDSSSAARVALDSAPELRPLRKAGGVFFRRLCETGGGSGGGRKRQAPFRGLGDGAAVREERRRRAHARRASALEAAGAAAAHAPNKLLLRRAIAARAEDGADDDDDDDDTTARLASALVAVEGVEGTCAVPRARRAPGEFAHPLAEAEVALAAAAAAGGAGGGASAAAAAVSPSAGGGGESACPPPPDDGVLLERPTRCYICGAQYLRLHHFFVRLCRACGDFNFAKRSAHLSPRARADGRVALVTGGRVKIGFWVALMLLRMGARVLVTTRFPNDAALRFSSQPDAADWCDRLHVFGLDLRFLRDVERFADLVVERFAHVDVLVNNAAQTVRRPPAFYAHLMPTERLTELPNGAHSLVALRHPRLVGSADAGAGERAGDAAVALSVAADPPAHAGTPMHAAHSAAALSQLAVAPGDAPDAASARALFPRGLLDADSQQVDLRARTSWVLELEEVSTAELAEVQLVNAIAPYVLIQRLLPAMRASPHPDRFVVNVSAVEGQFYRRKSTKHPHTNMAKAALNMLTRTAAPHLATSRVWMNAVDTGWVSEMVPTPDAVRIAQEQQQQQQQQQPDDAGSGGGGFGGPSVTTLFERAPLDEIDGAARVLDPVVSVLSGGEPVWGKFHKDYKITLW